MATLTTAQLQTLKNHINASSDLNSQPMNGDGDYEIARLVNLTNVPNWTVWKTLVHIKDVMESINGGDLGNLTTANHTALQTVIMGFTQGINPSKPDIRQMLDDIFSGAAGATTRANLLVTYKQLATRFQKLYTTGTGTDTTPANLVIEDPCTQGNV